MCVCVCVFVSVKIFCTFIPASVCMSNFTVTYGTSVDKQAKLLALMNLSQIFWATLLIFP